MQTTCLWQVRFSAGHSHIRCVNSIRSLWLRRHRRARQALTGCGSKKLGSWPRERHPGLGFHCAHRHAGNVRGAAFMAAVYHPVRWSDVPADFKICFKLMRMPGIVWLMISLFFLNRILPQASVRRLPEIERALFREPFPTARSRRPSANGQAKSRPMGIPRTFTNREKSQPLAAGGRDTDAAVARGPRRSDP